MMEIVMLLRKIMLIRNKKSKESALEITDLFIRTELSILFLLWIVMMIILLLANHVWRNHQIIGDMRL
jgi:hypothetical protein